MKKYKAVILSSALLLSASGSTKAQIINTTTDGMTQGQVWSNIYADNTRAAAAQAAMSTNNLMMAALIAEAKAKQERIEKAGAAKIAAGKVTTHFSSTLAGTQALIKNLSFDETAPQDAIGQLRYIQRYVKLFDQLAAQNGFAVNDSADGYAFAYALSFAAYNNKDLDNAEIEKLRRETKQTLLKHAQYQGFPDVDRQYTYELNAALAAQAAEQRAFYRRATSEAERQKHEERAKFFAKFVLDTKEN